MNGASQGGGRRCAQGKVPFESKTAAKHFARSLASGNPQLNQVPYCCPSCGFWHLTSRAPRATMRKSRRHRGVRR